MALCGAPYGRSNMNSYVAIFFAVLALAGSSFAGVVPAAVAAAPLAAPLAAPIAAAPVVAPAAVGYAKAIPYNLPPHASRVDITSKAIAAPILAAPGAPFFAAAGAPIVAAPTAPFVAAPSAPFVAAPSAPFVAAPSAPFVAPGYFQATYGGFAAPFVVG